MGEVFAAVCGLPEEIAGGEVAVGSSNRIILVGVRRACAWASSGSGAHGDEGTAGVEVAAGKSAARPEGWGGGDSSKLVGLFIPSLIGRSALAVAAGAEEAATAAARS